MTVRNPEWYDLNESRSWPLADQAAAIDDAGFRMPNNLIADMSICFPQAAGEFAFLSAVSVGPAIATAVILSSAAGYPPLAAVTVTTPVEAYRHYAVTPLYPGVGGWLVFGSAVANPTICSYRFSTPTQSLLMPQVARTYAPAPIEYVGKYGSLTSLTGIVKLLGGNDIEIIKDTREIDDVVRDVIVIRLLSETAAEAENVLSKYAGPCGGRPESATCPGTPPIELINSVAPDCCGTIILEFRGAADVAIVDNDPNSIVLESPFGLQEACNQLDRLPDAAGKLPNEYDDLCDGVVSSSSSSSY